MLHIFAGSCPGAGQWRSRGVLRIVGATVALAALLTARPALATEDEWLGADKIRHGVVSASFASGVSMVARSQTSSRVTPLLIGGGFTLGLGVAKETYDALGNGQASWKDLTWDVIGTAVGLGIALGVDLLFLRE